ncbi:MAG: GxxExxY protein [Candidatus Eremiobacteraeota bacterium]|nr:GxxExxY protein [Candidatus Eremiobacteraeota bacterium]
MGVCIEALTNLGTELLESANEQCLCKEFELRGIKSER